MFDYSSEYFASLEGRWTQISFPRISPLVQASLAEVRAGHVLDLGCGNGAYAPVLAEQGRTVHGIDISETAVDTCRKLGLYETVTRSRADLLPFSDNYFAAAFSTEVLEHIEDVSPTMSEVVRVLSDGGVCVLTTTLYAGSIWTYWGQSEIGRHGVATRIRECGRYLAGFVSQREQERFIRTWCFEPLGGHYHGFHVRQLRQLFNATGLKVKRVTRLYAVEPIPLLGGGRLGHVMHKPFPANVLLLPVALIIRMANVALRFAGLGANNVLMVGQKES